MWAGWPPFKAMRRSRTLPPYAVLAASRNQCTTIRFVEEATKPKPRSATHSNTPIIALNSIIVWLAFNAEKQTAHEMKRASTSNRCLSLDLISHSEANVPYRSCCWSPVVMNHSGR